MKQKIRIVVIGAGWMAGVRGRALLATGDVEIVAVASRHEATAGKLAADLGCSVAVADYRRLDSVSADAALVEVPHAAQHAIVTWALQRKRHTLIGGTLASNSAEADQIAAAARAGSLVVESGYEARYSAWWQLARDLVTTGALGDLVAVRSIALWGGDPATWYYREAPSGGMPLTHMTYCFLNPVRWIVGRPVAVSAFANRKKETAPEMICEETCLANVLFEDDLPYSLTAGFVRPGDLPAWSATFIGTAGAVDVRPTEDRPPSVTIYRTGAPAEEADFADARNPFEVQAEAFLDAIRGEGPTRNPPEDSAVDVRLAEAIVRSARSSGQLISL